MPAKNTVVRGSRSKRVQRKQSQSKAQVEILSSKTVFQGSVFGVTSDRVKEPGGVVVRRDIVRHRGSVVIIAVDDSGPELRVVLERQYRYAARDYLWEVPSGSIDPGEAPLSGAKRELLEETGYRAKTWSRAFSFYPSPGVLDETMTVYLARGLTPGKAQPEKDEFIECALKPLSDVVEMVLSGRIRAGNTIASVLWLTESLRRRKR